MSRGGRCLVTTVVMCSLLCRAHSYTLPRADIGHPAGYLPECPGVTKNASISPRMMHNLQVIYQRLDVRGQWVKTSYPALTAPRGLAKNKYIDFRRRKTVLYAVGYFELSGFPHTTAVGSSYARRGYNVLITETFSFLTHVYPKSARLVRTIGTKIGDMLVKLTEQGLRAEDLELVGLSLGSHIAGFAAKHFYKKTGKKPSKITGLDPAGPCFRNLPAEARLDSSDAERVSVLHTNIDGFGIAEPLGHVDFYANGGEFQPGDIGAIPCLVICSHLKAVLYWWQALENPRKFIGVRCESVQDARLANCYNSTVRNYLGLETDYSRPGIYYLSTFNEFPYYRGKEGLKAENEIYTSESRRMNEGDLIV